MARWNVNLDGKTIDAVSFADGMTADAVKTALVNHDGFDPAITVTEATTAPALIAFTVVGYYDDSTQLFTDWVEATDAGDAFAKSKAKTANDGDLVYVGAVKGHVFVTPPCEDSGKVCSADDITGHFLVNDGPKCCSCGSTDVVSVSGKNRKGKEEDHDVCQNCGCHMSEETGEEVRCF